jgi:hypothetical protein
VTLEIIGQGFASASRVLVAASQKTPSSIEPAASGAARRERPSRERPGHRHGPEPSRDGHLCA